MGSQSMTDCHEELPDARGDGYHVCFRAPGHAGYHVCTCGREWSRTDLPTEHVQLLEALRVAHAVGDWCAAERDRLHDIVQDIVDHANPIAEDDDGFVAVGYTVTVGAIHRAIAALQGATADPANHETSDDA